MAQPADRRVVLRWTFLSFGWLLILATRPVVEYVLNGPAWADLLFPRDTLRHRQLLAIAALYVLLSGVFCLVTASGLKRNRRWARWAGVATCTVLLAGFPWLSVAGAIGLFVLIAKPPQLGDRSPRSKDYWTRKRQSFLQPVISSMLLLVSMGAVGWFRAEARRAGMPAFQSTPEWWVWLFVSFLLQTALHEFGHAMVAWAFHSEIKAISIGPFLLAHDGYRLEFHFNWKRLLDSSGYMGAVPDSEKNLRWRQAAIVAAGPAASLLTGLVLLAGFQWLAANQWQGYWPMVAFNSVLGFYYGVANLIPVGYSDGSMLFHLALGTRAGQSLLSRLAVTRMQEEARLCHDRADFETEAGWREAAAARVLSDGEGSAVAAALIHNMEGHARLSLEDWHSAEAAFRRCLAFEAECAEHPELGGLAWSGLHLACVGRQHTSEAARAGAAAAAALETRKKKSKDRTSRGVTQAVLAELHQHAGRWEQALAEAQEALRTLPRQPRLSLLRAITVGTQAQCELCLGYTDAGLASARRAAELLRSSEQSDRRNLAWNELAQLGEKLWQAGQSQAAVEVMREAIDGLESGEAAARAARWRIKLAGILRQLERRDEAWQLLPEEPAAPAGLRAAFLAERAQLRLPEWPEEAVADCQELLIHWSELRNADAETAAARSLLAKACLEAGACEQADVLARKAGAVLEGWQHPEAQSCRITRMLARGLAAQEILLGGAAEIVATMEADPLLAPAGKARLLETEAARLERHGRWEEAQPLRAGAARQWRMLGLEPAPLAPPAPAIHVATITAATISLHG